MDNIFGRTEQKRPVYPQGAFDENVLAVEVLPSVESLPVGTCRLLTVCTADHPANVVYIIREINGVKNWYDIRRTFEDALAWDNPKFWKRITPDAITLHWEDPESDLWVKTVIVRKRGTEPTSITDGEIVGTSTVKNQYGLKTKGFVSPLFPEDTDYYYRLFAMNVSDLATPSYSLRSSWTWDEISATIQDTSIAENMHEYCFRVGDVFELPENIIYPGKKIHARIVDFNYSKIDDGTKPKSITFLTEEVLGNMSFSNKELKYAKTIDVTFIGDKRYFLKVEGKTEPEEFFWRVPNPYSDHGFKKNDKIPDALQPQLLELQASWRYFREVATVVSPSVKDEQVCDKMGSSYWNLSNLRMWLLGNQTDLNPEEYLKNNDPVYEWWNETADDHESWKAIKNGWFTAPTGYYHHLAPASLNSGRYIGLPPFTTGFTSDEGKRFVQNLLYVYNSTITDQYVFRYNRNTYVSDLDKSSIVASGTDHPGAIETPDKFWLPSFEEIYGRRPTYGINGEIDTTEIGQTHEGTQFKYFKENPAFKDCRVKYDLDGKPCGWYLRSCDPTTVSRLFYVGTELPESDTVKRAVETTCTAHRFEVFGSDEPRIGPAVCFTLGAPQN